MQKIVLASQSPRRKQLMEWAELKFDVIVQPTDESYPGNLTPPEIALHIARNKAIKVRESEIFKRYETKSTIIAADTIVVLGSSILGKPEDRQDAIRILQSLSGKKHEVITGVVLLGQDQEISFADTTEVWFHPLQDSQIEYYVDRYLPFDKAGAYAIQEWIGVVGIRSVIGDFYNVMGLPISRVIQALQQLNPE